MDYLIIVIKLMVLRRYVYSSCYSIEKAKNIFPVICPFILYPLEVYTHESLTTGPWASIEPPTAGFLFTVSGYLLKVSNSHNLVPVSELTA